MVAAGHDFLECEDGGVSRPQPAVTGGLASQKKIAAYLPFAVAFVLSVGMGYTVLGPFVAVHVHGDVLHLNHQQPLYKAAFAPQLTGRLARHSAPVTANKIAMSDVQPGEILKGKVRWFNSAKGYGFIAVEGRDGDIFVHQSEIYAAGFRSLAENEYVEFKLATDPRTGKVKALKVTGPGGKYVQGSQPDQEEKPAAEEVMSKEVAKPTEAPPIEDAPKKEEPQPVSKEVAKPTEAPPIEEAPKKEEPQPVEEGQSKEEAKAAEAPAAEVPPREDEPEAPVPPKEEAPFSVGELVWRRDDNSEYGWGKGYVTSINPLEVTVSSEDPAGKGYSWDEVRHIEAEAEQKLTVKFSPGALGLTVRKTDGKVRAVLQGQAQEQGVKVDMRMTRIGGQQFSWELFRSQISGTEDYEVEFIDEA